MKVYAGSVILEPTLNGNDLGEIAKKGVWLAKAGFGAFKTAFEYAPLVAAARAHGMITTCHTGGSSIPGSGAITGDHLLAMKPHVSFHVNGGPTAMPDRDFERIIVEGDMALQVCTAGNLRTALLCATLAQRHGAFDRLIVATDTPTGSGEPPIFQGQPPPATATPEPAALVMATFAVPIVAIFWRRRQNTAASPGDALH